MMTDTQMMTCSKHCASALREDDQHGAVYGPYALEEEDGSLRFVNRLEFAGNTGRCIYDGKLLPRGRWKRILARLAERRGET